MLWYGTGELSDRDRLRFGMWSGFEDFGPKMLNYCKLSYLIAFKVLSKHKTMSYDYCK